MFKRALSVALLPILIATLLSPFAYANESDVYVPDNANKSDPLGRFKYLQRGFNVGEFTGAALYEYPFVLPEGRNGMTPTVQLTYNSQSGAFDNRVGWQWNLNLYSIRRFNKVGVEQLYSRNDFVATTPVGSGELLELALSDGTHGLYGQKVEQAHAKYEFLPDNSWLVTDKQGVQYKFGTGPESQQFNPDQPEEVHTWYLEEVRDKNDNFSRYTYAKYDNQIYPKTIHYTGHGNADGIFEVRFLPFANGNAGVMRPDNHYGYSRGFRVDTKHLVNGLEVWVDGQRRREYRIDYTQIDPLIRQTISQISETGYSLSGQATSLPATTFDYTPSEVRWTETTDYSPNWLFEKCHHVCEGASNILQWDMNGDGLDDFEFFTSGSERKRATNNGKGDWIYGESEFLGGSPGYDNAIPSVNRKIFDIDGDLLIDHVRSDRRILPGSIEKIDSFIKLATGFNFTDTIPIAFGTGNVHGLDNGASVADLNGDGLPDIIQSRQPYRSSFTQKNTCLNREGSRCEETNLWLAPEKIIYDAQHNQPPRGFVVSDCNHDGLADLHATSGRPIFTTYINDGRGGFIGGHDQCSTVGFESTNRRFADVNGDGLTDIVHSYIHIGFGSDTYYNDVYLNTGAGSENINGLLPFQFGASGASQFHGDYGVRITDLNGDLLPDFIQSLEQKDPNTGLLIGTEKHVYYNTGSRPYFLKRVHTAEGGRIDYSYKTSAQYIKPDGTQANPKLPIIVTTLQSVTETPVLSTVKSTQYFYEDGHYHYDSSEQREFAGFRKVTKTEAGFKTIIYFHQGPHSISDSTNGEFEDHINKNGLPYRTEIYDKQDRLLRSAINRYELNGRQPVLKRSITVDINPQTNQRKSKAVEYEYDAYGNQTKVTDFGEVNLSGEDGSFGDLGNDLLETQTIFSLNEVEHLVAYPAEQKVIGQNGAMLTHQRFIYDNLPLGEVSIGNLTSSETLLDTSNEFLVSSAEFNEFGLPIRQANPRGFETLTEYDGNHLYPSRITNALGHSETYITDPATGQSLEHVDINGVRTVSTYDGLGRTTKLERSNPNGGGLVTISQQSYGDQSMPRSVHTTTYNDDGESVESYQYFDGLGRPVVSKQEASNNQWITSGQDYDGRGLPLKQFQPFFSSHSSHETPNGLGTLQRYDALGRVIEVQTPVGNTTTVYDGWNQTITDPNGNTKKLQYGSRGELLEVVEHNGLDSYITTYNYDSLSRLTDITDANGNQREFSYDSLGRRLTQTSAHRPGLAGSKWSYEYDKNGNMLQRIDPIGQTVTYRYDGLDRLLVEDFVGSPETEWQFSYDEGLFGLGRLSRVTGAEYQKDLTYDAWGRVLSETKTIHGQPYTFDYQYDQLGGITSMTYPDGSQLAHDYDSSHRLSMVFDNERVYADQFAYSPLEQLEQIRIGSTVVTTNTYDENQLYRLVKRVSIRTAELLQDFDYLYDAVGNLLSLLDASIDAKLPEASYAYDDLNRLTQAAFGEQFTIDYQYDPIGNITFKTGLGAYEYTGAHPHAVTKAGNEVFEYDANGNQINRSGELIGYDYKDQMTTSGGTTAYAYDEGKQRISKMNNETGERKIYVNQYYEIDPYDETRFVYAGDLKIAKLNRVLAERTEEGATEEPVEDPVEEPTEDPTPQPEANPEPEPDPEPIVTAAPATPTIPTSSGGGGSGSVESTGSSHQLTYAKTGSLFRIKKPSIPKKPDEEVITTQSAKKPKLPRRIEVKEDPSITFENLRITYRPNKAIIKWDHMPDNVVKFAIYRSKKPYPSTASKHAGTPLAHIPSHHYKNVFTDENIENGEQYSYQIAAKNAEGHVLTTSIRLNAEQVFIHPDGGTVNLKKYSDANFNKVFIKNSSYFSFDRRSDTKVEIKPKNIQTGAEIMVRFLNCVPKANGGEHCEAVDEKTLEVYLIEQPKIAGRFSKWISNLFRLKI